jgi:type II secretion system protein N
MALELPTFRRLGGQLGQLGPRARKVLRYAGFAVLGLVSFVLAFQAAFPFGRVKDKIIESLAEKYEVTIGSVEGGWLPGRVYFRGISLLPRATKPDELPTRFNIEQLQVDVGLLAALRGTTQVALDATIGDAKNGHGHILADLAVSSSGTQVSVVSDEVPSASLPVRELIGLPMSGKLTFAVDFDLPNDKSKAGKVGPNWPKATGTISLACPAGCTIGDGKSKLRVNLKNQRQQAFAEGGIDFGKVSLDTLVANVELKSGKLDLTRFEIKSPDGEAHVDFDMVMNQDINQSMVTGCLRFRGSEGLGKREPKTYAALSTTGANLERDSLYHIKLDGPLHDIRRLPQACGPVVATESSGGGPKPRPNLTISPETPTVVPGAPPVLPPAQPPAMTAQPYQPPPPAAAPPMGSSGSGGSSMPTTVPSSNPAPESTGGGPNTIPLPGTEPQPGSGTGVPPGNGQGNGPGNGSTTPPPGPPE